MDERDKTHCCWPLALASALTRRRRSALAPKTRIKIGLLATFEGPFTVLGEDGMRGAELALKEVNGTAGGKKIEIVKGSSDASPDSAVRAARKLVEQDGVQDPGRAALGRRRPRGQGLRQDAAERDLRQRHLGRAGHDAARSGAELLPLLHRRRAVDGRPRHYAFKDKGYKKVATVAEDYSFPYTQVFGFMAEFCKAGGHVPSKSWVPIGNKDFSSVIAAIPDDVDAIYVALGGADGVNFLTQYQQAGGTAPLIGGSITVDQTVLGSQGQAAATSSIGTPSAGPIADNKDAPAWKKFVAAYKKHAGRLSRRPSLFAHGYYVNTKALLLALDKVNGDVSDGGAKLRDALSKLAFDTPTGKVSLDKNRNAIADIFLTEVAEGADGNLYNKLVKVMPQVNQTLGHSRRRVHEARRGQPRQPELPVTAETSAAASGRKSVARASAELRRLCARARRRGAAFRRAGGARRHQHEDRGRRTARGPRLERRRQDDAVQRHHRRFPADRRAASASSARTSPTLPPHERIRRGLRRTYQISQLFGGLERPRHRLPRLPRRLARPLLAAAAARATTSTWCRRERSCTPSISKACATRWSATLSHGQQRQLEIALALAGAPRFILFDEPAAGLSPTERRDLVAILNALPKHIGYIIIEHDLDVALRVSEYVTMMHNGRVFKEGTPQEIENDPEVQEIYLGGGHG